MEKLQNENVDLTTSSQLSAWNGTVILLDQTENEAIRLGEDKMVPDHLDLTKRLYNVLQYATTSGIVLNDYIPLGPSQPTSFGIVDLYRLFSSSPPLKAALSLYEGFSYDSLDFTVSVSDVKGLTGALMVGYYPHKNWYDVTQASELAALTLNDMTKKNVVNSAPECQLVSLSAAQDVKFTVPWQHPVPFLPRASVKGNWTTRTPPSGTPVPFFWLPVSHYVSSVSLPAQLRMFVKFNGLRFYGPNIIDNFMTYDQQSGLEVAAAAASAYVVESVVESGAEIVRDVIGVSNDDALEETYKAGTYEAPTAVQMAYAGDTTAVGPPGTSPILFRNLESRSSHDLLTFLKRPQYLATLNTGTAVRLHANPTFPYGVKRGANQIPTYFAWFAQAAMYWRGTLNFHFVILGHPMVEVRHSLLMYFPPNYTSDNNDMAGLPTLRGITNGTQHIVVPMPSMNVLDHLPVIDNVYDDMTEEVNKFSSSRLYAGFDVVSTMLDITPTIPILVFMSAGDDFTFLQPNAVGLGYADNLPVPPPFGKSKLRRKKTYEQQVGLCPHDIVFETKATAQLHTKTLPVIKTVEDLFKIWCRALPYSAYASNDEPIVDIHAGTSPCWWPPGGGSAAATLNVNNSWWITNDYVSLYSAHFLYFRGSLGFKVILKPGAEPSYKYVALAAPDDLLRQKGHNPYTFTEGQMPPEANFGYGTVVTPDALQPVLDATIPYRSGLTWSPVNPIELDHSSLSPSISAGTVMNRIKTNITLQEPDGDLLSALFRKGGSDYAVSVEGLLPPPTLWMAKGYNWS